MVLFANQHSQKDPDDDHPYGHQRFETGASLVLGLLAVWRRLADDADLRKDVGLFLAVTVRLLRRPALIAGVFAVLGSAAVLVFVVDHAILEPQIRNFEPDHVIDDGRHELRGAKDVRHIDPRASLLAGGSVR